MMLLAAAAVLAPTTAAFAQTAPAPAPTAPAPQPARKEGGNTVQEVTVTGQRSDFRSSIDRRSYSVASDLGATTGSIGDALRNVPSVEVDVSGNVSLRGDSNVTILIDGKPSGMFSGEGRGDALQQLPADQIDRVEVMTNPSAAFSPDGTAGVINLVSKKGRKAGRSGTVRGHVGLDGRYGTGLSGSYMSGKLTLSGDAGLRHDVFEGESETERARRATTSDPFIESRQTSRSDGAGDSRNLRASLDYDLDDATRVSAEVRHRGMKFDSDVIETYEGQDSLGPVVYDRLAKTGFERANTGANASWRRKFSGDEHELVADLSFERTESERATQSLREYDSPVQPAVYEDIGGDFVQDQTRLKVDYSRPLPNDSKLKTGVELELAQNDYDNYGLRGEDAASADPVVSLTNRFLYEQTIQAAYGTYERPLGPVTAQVGLRLEQVNIDINQVTSSITRQNDYFGAYPSVHLGYDLTDKQQLTASYSHRVQRPRPEELNPYVVEIDPNNKRSGNPDLEPQQTHSFEAGWQYRSGQTFYLATAYYRQSENGVTDVVQVLPDGVFLTTRENLAESRSGGLELVANGKLTSKLSYNVSSNVFWNEIQAAAATGETRSGVSVGGRGNLNWQITPKDFLQLNAFVMGRRLQAQGYREPSGMLNFGYRHKFSDKLSFTVTGQDLLETMRDEVVIDTALIQDRIERRQGTRAVFVGLTYTFGDGGKRQREGFDFDTGGGPGG